MYMTVSSGWLEEICSHMTRKVKPKGYWDKENCRKEALKYDDMKTFAKLSGGAHDSMVRNGWIKELTKHIERNHKPKGYWTKENCRKEILKYNTINEVKNNAIHTYNIICKNGWKDELCSHIKYNRKPIGYWTKERCTEEASKYNSRSKLSKGNTSAYQAAHRNGWLDELF